MKKMNNELEYFDALKRITAYQTPDQLRKRCEKDWGLAYTEALEYAYENIQSEARRVLHGSRRPKLKQVPVAIETKPDSTA